MHYQKFNLTTEKHTHTNVRTDMCLCLPMSYLCFIIKNALKTYEMYECFLEPVENITYTYR